jgi:hypothetical protein
MTCGVKPAKYQGGSLHLHVFEFGTFSLLA